MGPYRTFSIDSLQIIESKNAFLLKNEIGSSTTPRIRQYIDTIAMLYSLACCINQIVEVVTLFAYSTINTGFTLYRAEFSMVDYELQLINKLGSFQIV